MKLYRTILSLIRSEKSLVMTDQVLVSGTTFVTTILVARQLSVEQFSWFASVVLLQLFLLAVQHALIIGPYQVLQADYNCSNGKAFRDAGVMIQGIFLVVLLLTSTVFYCFTPSLLHPFVPGWWWISFSVTAFLLQDYLRRIFITEGTAWKALVIDLITSLLQLIVLCYLFWQHQLSLTICFIVIGATFIPSILAGLYWLHWKPMGVAVFRRTWRKYFYHGKWLLVTALLQWWAGNFFIVAAGVLLGPIAFGALRLAQNIFGVLNVLFQAFENYVVPNAARVYKQSAGALQSYIRQVSLKTAGLVVPVLAAMIVFAKPLIGLAGGAQYETYAYLLQGMSVLYLFIFLGYPVRIAIRVLLLNKAFFTGYIVTAVFSFLAANLFISKWSVYGVIAGLIINQLLMVSYWLFILKRKNLVLWKSYT